MMTISITQPELQQLVEKKVRTGEYDSPEDVVAAALTMTLMQDDDLLSPEQLEWLRQEIGIGMQQAARGEFVEFTAEDIIRQETKKLQARRERNGH